MKPILVSTITPCFRMKPYLKKFLEELPMQTMFDQMEVILDHNEPDEEEIALVKEFQAKYPNRIKHIIVNPVEVIGASMNRCIKEASGKYVAIWNVDDLRTPGSIESQVRAIEEKNSDIAIGDYKVVRKFGEKEKGNLVVEHSDVPESEFKRSMYFGPFVMFKKSLCEEAGYFDEQLTSGADFDLCVRLAYNGKVSISNNLLGYYLNEGKGASTRPGSKQAIDKTVILLRYGIFDKIDASMIPRTVTFSIPNIVSYGETSNVSKYVPNYKDIILVNLPSFKKALYVSAVSTFLRFKEIKLFIKQKIKTTLYANK